MSLSFSPPFSIPFHFLILKKIFASNLCICTAALTYQLMFDQDLGSRLSRQTHLKVSMLETPVLLQITLVLEQKKLAS